MIEQSKSNKPAPVAVEDAHAAGRETTLLPMLIIGLVLITIGYFFIMAFV